MDAFGKLLDVGDRVFILSTLMWERYSPEIESQNGIVFGIAAADAYIVYLDGPPQKGWEGWGSSIYALLPGKFLMKYDYEWSYT